MYWQFYQVPFIVKSELRSPLFTVHKTKHMAQNKVARVVALLSTLGKSFGD